MRLLWPRQLESRCAREGDPVPHPEPREGLHPQRARGQGEDGLWADDREAGGGGRGPAAGGEAAEGGGADQTVWGEENGEKIIVSSATSE